MGAVTRCMHFVTASFYGGHMYIEGVGEVEVIRKRISRMYIHVGRGRHVFVTAPRTCSEDLIRRFLTEKKTGSWRLLRRRRKQWNMNIPMGKSIFFWERK